MISLIQGFLARCCSRSLLIPRALRRVRILHPVTIACLLSCFPGRLLAAEHALPHLENKALVVQVAQDGRLTVKDRRTETVWRQVEMPLPWLQAANPTERPRAYEVDTSGRKLRWSEALPGIRKGNPDTWELAEFSFELSLDADQPLNSKVSLKITGNAGAGVAEDHFAVRRGDTRAR